MEQKAFLCRDSVEREMELNQALQIAATEEVVCFLTNLGGNMVLGYVDDVLTGEKRVVMKTTGGDIGGETINNSIPVNERIKNVAQQSYDYAVQNPRNQSMNRMQLGKDAEVQATRWTRKWAKRNGIDLSENGLHFQVRGKHSVPDVVYEPTRNIWDFKLTPKAIREA